MHFNVFVLLCDNVDPSLIISNSLLEVNTLSCSGVVNWGLGPRPTYTYNSSFWAPTVMMVIIMVVALPKYIIIQFGQRPNLGNTHTPRVTHSVGWIQAFSLELPFSILRHVRVYRVGEHLITYSVTHIGIALLHTRTVHHRTVRYCTTPPPRITHTTDNTHTHTQHGSYTPRLTHTHHGLPTPHCGFGPGVQS